MSEHDDVVEAMARGMWGAFCAAQTHPENCPSWEELKAQGHQGRHRINEFLGYAVAAIRALPLGWVVAKVPEDKPSNYAMGVYANEQRLIGHNAALAAVRASAVEVGEWVRRTGKPAVTL